VENYQTVLAGQTTCRLLNTTRIEIAVDIPESMIAMVPFVTNISCVFDAFPDVPIVGARVKEIGTEASDITRTYPVTLVMDQPDAATGAKILPGMAGRVYGKARLPEEVVTEGFVIPEAAIFDGDDGRKYVWLIDESSMTAHRSDPVVPGALSPIGIHVEGLQAGQWIATAGVHYIQEGQEVQILAEPTGQAHATAEMPGEAPKTEMPATEDTE
jgi:multidrug efflux pump subunit AcrA (membrane-fusion protein)